MERGSYNFIYTERVKNEDDTLGIIAYSFYKRQKSNSSKASKPVTGGRLLTLICHFHEVSNSEFQLQAYRNQADQLAQDFLTITLETRAKNLKNIMTRSLRAK